MFSLSEGQRQQPPKHTAISTAEKPQQSAPTEVALAAAAPAVAAVAGARVFPAVSSKGVAEAPASSAGAASAAVLFSPLRPWGGGQGARFCRWNSDIDGGPAAGGVVPSAASVWGAPASSAIAAASAEVSAAEPLTSGTVLSAASIRGQSGRASRLLERRHRMRKQRRQPRPAVLLPLLRRRRGRLERSRQQLVRLVTAG